MSPQQFVAFRKEVWQHITYTHDVYGGTIYVDGELKDHSILPIRLSETKIPIIIDADNLRSEQMIRFFTGQIDDVRIYNRALSAEEVKALYDFEKPKSK